MSWGPGGGPEQQTNRKQNLSGQETGHRNKIRFQSILMLLFSWQFLLGEDFLLVNLIIILRFYILNESSFYLISCSTKNQGCRCQCVRYVGGGRGI